LVLPIGHDWNLSILSEYGTKTIELATPTVKSLLTTVPGFGWYHLNASSIALSGQLVTDSVTSTFLANSSRVFFPIAQFQQQSLPTAPVRTKTALPSGLVQPTITPLLTVYSSADSDPNAGKLIVTLSTPVIVGISIGAVAFVVAVVGVICYIRRRRQNEKALFSDEASVPYTSSL
jgi:hypothetical protein